MLDIYFEFRRGVLFIRLMGSLTKNTIKKLDNDVTTLIRDNGIRNVVFNVSGLTKIDLRGISRLFYNYELCKRNSGVSLLCCVDNKSVYEKIKSSRLLKYMVDLNDELSAFNFIE
jgi:anti-anti-sigma factor